MKRIIMLACLFSVSCTEQESSPTAGGEDAGLAVGCPGTEVQLLPWREDGCAETSAPIEGCAVNIEAPSTPDWEHQFQYCVASEMGNQFMSPVDAAFLEGTWSGCGVLDLWGDTYPFSCEFSECERPPRSTCERDTFCNGELRCGEPDSNYDADGCQRLRCADASDCAEDERCVAMIMLVYSCSAGLAGLEGGGTDIPGEKFCVEDANPAL